MKSDFLNVHKKLVLHSLKLEWTVILGTKFLNLIVYSLYIPHYTVVGIKTFKAT